jgi:small-conductance mechanosensitive channel
VDTISQIPQDWLADFIRFIPRLMFSLVLFALTLALAGVLSRIVRQALTRRQADPELTLLVGQMTRWGVVTLGVIVALQQVNFDVAAFLTGVGIVGFTIGFAIQDVSKNFVAGVLLLLQQPFDMGDAVEVGDFAGTVETVTLRATELRTFDGRHVLIPNADVFTSPIVNYSRTNRRRVELAAGVAYDSDLELVRQTASEAIAGISGVLKKPAPNVVFDNLGPSTVDLTIYYWISTRQTNPFAAKDAGVKAIKTAFEGAGIDMPYPTQTVYVRQ